MVKIIPTNRVHVTNVENNKNRGGRTDRAKTTDEGKDIVIKKRGGIEMDRGGIRFCLIDNELIASRSTVSGDLNDKTICTNIIEMGKEGGDIRLTGGRAGMKVKGIETNTRKNATTIEKIERVRMYSSRVLETNDINKNTGEGGKREIDVTRRRKMGESRMLMRKKRG